MQFTDNHIGYGYCDKALMDEYGVEYTDCKDLVNQFGIVGDIEAWVLFIEDYLEHPGEFNASLRSRGCIVNEITIDMPRSDREGFDLTEEFLDYKRRITTLLE